MSILYSRVTPFGFIDPATATDEDKFYSEPITLRSKAAERDAVTLAEFARRITRESKLIQTTGGDSQDQSSEMHELLHNSLGGLLRGTSSKKAE